MADRTISQRPVLATRGRQAMGRCSRHSLLGIILAIGLFVGCGVKPELIPVNGKVTVDGKPAPGALVTFVPADAQAARPSGLVGEDGTFSIQTYDPETRQTNPGAQVGEYGVIVTWVPQPTEGNLDSGVALGDRLKGLFRDPAKSKLRVAVQAPSTELPLQLSTKGR